MVSLNVAKKQYANSIVIPTEPKEVTVDDSSTVPISEPKETEKVTKVTPSKTKSTKKDSKITGNNITENKASKSDDVSMVTQQESESMVFPDISFNLAPTIEQPVSLGTSTKEHVTVPLVDSADSTIPYINTTGHGSETTIDNSSFGSDKGVVQGNNIVSNVPKEVNLNGQSIPTTNSGISIVVYGSNNTITVNNSEASEVGETEGVESLPTLSDLKRVTTLEELDLLEAKFDEVFKYMKAKRTILEMDRDIK